MFSVVIPTHNRPQSLEAALTSVFEQQWPPSEVIVVDDGSTPPLSEAIFAQAPQAIACRLLRNEQPQGANGARNLGVKAASTEWVAFLDDDDQFLPNKLFAVAQLIQHNPDADGVYHGARVTLPRERVSYTTRPQAYPSTQELYQALLVSNTIGGTPMLVVRRQALLDVGLFSTHLSALEDYELWLRLARANKKLIRLPGALTECFYLTQTQSVSKQLAANQQALDWIEQHYATDYAKLSASELKQHQVWKRKLMVHKLLLNGQHKQAIQHQLRLVFFAPSLTQVVGWLVVLLGPTWAFKIKGWISS